LASRPESRAESGLNAKTIFGGEHKNKYLLETTGCGVAFYDYDNDGWLDNFIFPKVFPRTRATSHLSKQSRRHLRDVTAKAGLLHSGWGQGVCIATTKRRLRRSLRTYSEKSFSTQQRQRHLHRPSAKKPASPETAKR